MSEKNQNIQNNGSSENKLSYKNWSLRLKIQFNLFLIAAISSISIGWLGYSQGKKSLEEASFAQLTSVRESKKKQIENYLETVRKQVRTMADGRMMIDAANDFNLAYRMVDYYFSPGDVVKRRRDLQDYYINNIYHKFNDTDLVSEMQSDFVEMKDASILLQSLYIADNPNTLKEKSKLEKASDNSVFSDIHKKYHATFKNYAEQFDFKDIFIVDSNNGTVLYSMRKGTEFGSNLMTGPFRNTPLARSYVLARNSLRNNLVTLSDFEAYDGAYGEPMAFAASSIYENYEKVGVLIFMIPVKTINRIMDGDKEWMAEGLGQTGEAYIVGDDSLMRSDSRRYLEQESNYLNKIRQEGKDNETIDFIIEHKTTVLSQKVNTEAVREALKGRTGQLIGENYLGTEVLSAYTPLNIKGLSWVILAEMDAKESLASIEMLKLNVLIASLVIIALGYIVGRSYTLSLTKPIYLLQETIGKLSKGEETESITVESNDEIGETINSMNNLVVRTQKTSEFAQAIREGDFDKNFKVLGEKDILGNSLVKMKDRLKEVADEDQKRVWVTNGISKFAELLRQYNDDLETFYDVVLSNLVDYIDAKQGGLFVVEKLRGKDILVMKACYAYNRKKFLNKMIEAGEGVAGRSWQEKETIYMNEIPDSYTKIRSGLGDSGPQSILVVPLKFNEEVLGVIELASYEDMEPYKIEFVEKVAESIGSAILSTQHSSRTARLLEESQELTQELRSREEEMRQNTEELKATQEEMQRRQQELEKLRFTLQKQIAEKEQELEAYRAKAK